MISLLALNHNYNISKLDWVVKLFMLLALYPIIGLATMMFVEINFWPGYIFIGCLFYIFEFAFYGGTYHYYWDWHRPTPPRFTERWVFPFWGRCNNGLKVLK